MRFYFGFMALLVLCAQPVAAMEYSRNGVTVTLSGNIKPDDEHMMPKFFDRPENAGIRYINLVSGGGSVNAAIEVGRQIRRRNFETIVDGGRANCSSACTILFGSGVKRHYINSGAVQDGAFKFGGNGLGFHQASTQLSRQPSSFSGAGTGMVIGAYYEFGIGGASGLADKAPPNMIYRLSGPSAVQLGIATSLTLP